MQYLISLLHDQPTIEVTAEQEAAIDEFNASLEANGQWVFAGGLGVPDNATVVDARGETPIVTDGPFLESKEFMIGFWVVEAPDLDVALKLAAGGSKACHGRVEVRPFLELD